ncbi:hypothetical protein LCGC14_1822940 [marine sediment metagenome]|uniref:Uncharacterized protein n=1 Tax=marine sediment metagenome TaxID=412755 RepID=A0A0F9IY34_9ZZZZ
MTKNNDDDRKIVRIAKSLGRTLQWVTKAISKDSYRPMMTLMHVEPREGEFGTGVIYGTDGFRLHLAKDVNTGEVSDMPWYFDDVLDLEEGAYEVRVDVMFRDHINEFWKEELGESMRDIKGVTPSRRKDLKPVAIISINPRFLTDAIKNCKPNTAVFIRVFTDKKNFEKGKLITPSAIEVISTENAEKGKEGASRMAVIMPMHARDEEATEEWPIAFDGWPEEEVDEETESVNDG